MEIVTYITANDYLNENLQFLETEEAINSLIIGITFSLRDLKNDDTVYLSVKAENEIVLSGIKTKGRNFLVYGKTTINIHAIEALVDYLIYQKIEIPGIIGGKEIALKIADCWKAKTKNSYEIGFNQLVYILNEVNHLPEVQGSMKKATPIDLDFISKWFHQFLIEAMNNNDMENAHKTAEHKIANEEVFIWLDEEPVAIASIARPTKNGITVNYVYTPMTQRKKGYGTKLVAAISQLMLERGYKFCTLFTNLDNPTSNNIYQKIGYRPMKEFRYINIVK